MKTHFYALLALLAIGVSAAEPTFKPSVKLKLNGQPIDIKVGHLVPRPI